MVLPHRTAELLEADEAQSFVHKLQLSVSKGLPHAVPVPGLRTEEHELVGIQLLSYINMIVIPSGTSSS
jgi:gamma-tubulin complex component 5